MSDLWFNIRILFWHFQIQKGRLFRLKCEYNPWWLRKELLWKPAWICEFSPLVGWRERNNKAWRASTAGQAP